MRMDATLNEVCAMHPTALHILNLGDAAPVAYIGSMHVMLHALAWLLYAAICCSDRKSISRCPRDWRTSDWNKVAWALESHTGLRPICCSVCKMIFLGFAAAPTSTEQVLGVQRRPGHITHQLLGIYHISFCSRVSLAICKTRTTPTISWQYVSIHMTYSCPKHLTESHIKHTAGLHTPCTLTGLKGANARGT